MSDKPHDPNPNLNPPRIERPDVTEAERRAISRLRTHSGFWNGDENAITVLRDFAQSGQPTPELPTPFKAGDTVRHGPTGETWTLKRDEMDGHVYPCGWPETRARASDCTLIR